MAYSETIAARNRAARGLVGPSASVPSELYITPEILKKIWGTPLEVTRIQDIGGYIEKPFSDLVKASAMHIKEGLVYESRAAVWNNPLRPIEISGWGELNNYGGGDEKTRDAKLNAAISQDTARLNIYHGKSKKRTPAEEKVWKKRVAKYNTNNPHNAYISVTATKRGHEFMPLLFKRTAYFVAPKFSTLELRSDMEAFRRGKGQSYIELDGLIHVKKSNGKHKFLIFELKKEKGASGSEDAEQMRKAAALLRKWGYELTGEVPEVQLYFAAGAAESFASSETYSFNSEKNRVQNWAPRQIQSAVASSSGHIAYIRTPVFLLTGIGFAEILRIHPDRMAAIRSALSEASSVHEAWRAFSGVKPTSPRVKDLLVVADGKGWRKASDEDIEDRAGTKLYLDLFKAATDPDNEIARAFQQKTPPHWKIKTKNVHPTVALTRVSESIAFIQYMNAKLTRPNITENKKSKYRTEIIGQLKYILSPKYVKYIKNANVYKAKLRTLNATARNGNNVASPTRNVRFYKKVIKSRSVGPAVHVATRIGPLRYIEGLKAPANVKVGPKFAGVNNLMPEYFFKKGGNVNFGNLKPENFTNISNTHVSRWLEYISRKVVAPGKVNAANFNKFKVVLRGIINSRSQPFSGNLSDVKRARRLELVNEAKKALNRVSAERNVIRPNAGGNAQSERELKQRIWNAARGSMTANNFKSSFPAGISSVPAYVKRVTGSKVVNLRRFALNATRAGTIVSSPAPTRKK